MNTMQVLGFLVGSGKVLLVQKRSPEWQKGRLNGIGGVVGDGETPDEAIVRHGIRDIGYDGDWAEYAEISRESWSCRVYMGSLDSWNRLGGGEKIAGIFEFGDLRYLPMKTPLVKGVDILVHAALIRERDPEAPYVILRVDDGMLPHPIDIVDEMPHSAETGGGEAPGNDGSEL